MRASLTCSVGACTSSASFRYKSAFHKVAAFSDSKHNSRKSVVLRVKAVDSEEPPPKKKRGRPRRDSMPSQEAPFSMEDVYGKGPSASGSFDFDPMLDPSDEDQAYDWFNPSPEPVEITARPGTVEEWVQRVLTDQPRDPEFAPDQELRNLEYYVTRNGGNLYNLVMGLSARARAQEEAHLQNPTTLGDTTTPMQRAICELAREMEALGGEMDPVQVAFPKSAFKRYGKKNTSEDDEEDEEDIEAEEDEEAKSKV